MRIAVGVPRAQSYGQQVLEGILARCTRLGWSITPNCRGPVQRAELGAPGEIQGVISIVPDADCRRLIRRRNLPVVLVQASDRNLPQAIPDDRALGRLAAEHLLQRGYQQLAICPCVSAAFARDRADGFAQVARATGCHLVDGRREAESGYYDRQVLRHWLRKLPSGTALFTVLIGQGLECMRHLAALDRAVPDGIAVLSAEEDADIAAMSRPALSTVHFNGFGIGQAAMDMLQVQLAGRKLRTRLHRSPPLGVIQRGSCDAWACEDPVVLKALTCIRDHHDQLGFGVTTILESVDCSRRSLVQRFRRHFGRSVGEEIRRCRLDHAARLLRETERSLLPIALACGWSSARLAIAHCPSAWNTASMARSRA